MQKGGIMARESGRRGVGVGRCPHLGYLHCSFVCGIWMESGIGVLETALDFCEKASVNLCEQEDNV